MATAKNKSKQQEQQEEEVPQVPFWIRLLVIIVTSFSAEKVWSNRSFFTSSFYNENQTETERKLIAGFEFVLAMGFLFFLGIVISKVTTLLVPAPTKPKQRKNNVI